MDGNIIIGTIQIPIETAWKASVVGLLSAILALLGSMYLWLTG